MNKPILTIIAKFRDPYYNDEDEVFEFGVYISTRSNKTLEAHVDFGESYLGDTVAEIIEEMTSDGLYEFDLQI